MFNLRSFQGNTPQLGQRVYVDPCAAVIGRVILGDDVSIWPFVSVRGDLLTIQIGAKTNIQDNSILHTTKKSHYFPDGFALSIGEEVTIGHGVILHGCAIGHRCLIGMGAIILDGARIEDEVLLAAGSLVSPGKILEQGYLYRGHPAQKIRALTDAEKDYIKWNAEEYVANKDLYSVNEPVNRFF